MDKNASGIVSYAGLAREAVLSLAKAAFIQAQPPVPRRFEAFLPIFPVELVQNMDYVGQTEARNAMVAPSGFSTDPAEYHRKLYAQLPELYAEDNYRRNFDYEDRFVGRGVFTVDRVFADHFPQYGPFMGEKLNIYLIGGGFQAVAVPESVYPRGGGLLAAQELAMQVTARVELVMQYLKTRMAAGDRYEPETFAAEYLRVSKVTPLCFTQEEISRVLQDLSIVRSLQSDTASVGLYTQSARKAERVLQYVPMRYACDLFAPEAVDKHTARLAQLHFADVEYTSDLWIPWQDFAAYIDRRTMTLDARALCEGYQIAPRYDADTYGGAYPDGVRVAVVRDRDLMLMVAGALNNPAYGSGMGPQGTIGRHVYIADSREMLRQRKLALEEFAVSVSNTALPPAEYRKALLMAVLQEHKGRLVDAMYRRETVLAQIDPQTPVFDKAAQLLGERVARLQEIVAREGKQSGSGQMSGYDADIDYLTRKGRNREGEPQQSRTGKPIAFTPDPQREESIESGYAMRAGLLRMTYAQAALPEPPAAPPVGADDSEDEPGREPLPPLPSVQRTAAGAPQVKTAAPQPAVQPVLVMDTAQEADEVTVAGGAKAGKGPNHAPQPGKAVAAGQAQQTPAAPADKPTSAPQTKPLVTPGVAASPIQNTAPAAAQANRDATATAAVPIATQTATAANAADTAPAAVKTASIASAPVAAQTAAQAATGATGQDTAHAAMQAGSPTPMPKVKPATTADAKPADSQVQLSGAMPAATPVETQAAAPAGEAAPPQVLAAQGDAGSEPPQTFAAPDGQDTSDGLSGDANTADTAPAAPETPADPALQHKPVRAGRVSLRELSQRITPVPEPPPAAQPPETPVKAEETPQPKLAYILRRSSEATASQSYNRMSDMLQKKGK